jgi:hypothetical protein
VEEQDGKVEREFMVLDGTLQFKKVSIVTCKIYMFCNEHTSEHDESHSWLI